MLAPVVILAEIGGYAGTLDASDQVEVRARVTEGDPGSPAIDLLDTANVRLALNDRRWDHFVSYTPSFTAPYLFQSGSTTLLLHSGSVGTSWHDRRVRLTLTEDGNYGEQNLTLLTPVAAGADGRVPPAQIAAAPETMRYGMTRTTLSSQVILDPRLSARASAAYLLQGGLDDRSRELFPLQRGPQVTGGVAYQVARTDAVETDVVGQTSVSTSALCPAAVTGNVQTTLMCDPQAQLAYATEAWRHNFSRVFTSSIGVGPAFARTRIHSDQAWDSQVLVAGSATFEYTWHAPPVKTGLPPVLPPQPKGIRVDALLAPVVDVRTGTTDYRANLSGLVRFPMGETTWHAQLWLIQSVSTVITPPLTLARAEWGVERLLSEWFGLGYGVRVEREHQPSLGTFSSGLVFVQATVRAPTTRF